MRVETKRPTEEERDARDEKATKDARTKFLDALFSGYVVEDALDPEERRFLERQVDVAILSGMVIGLRIFLDNVSSEGADLLADMEELLELQKTAPS